jgi:putative Holliday junction resolvase
LKDYTALGFDFGVKHIGVAVGQTVTGTANPLPSLKAAAGIPQWDKITALIEYWQPTVLMVGIPFALDGSEQAITRHTRRFIGALQQRYALPVHVVDERFTTKEAREHLFAEGGYRALDKASVDGWSAKLIVESGLRDWRYEGDEPDN